MFDYILPLLGAGILGFSVFLAVKKRHNTSKFITCLTLGIFFSTVFMVMPTDWKSSVTTEPFYTFVSSVLYSLKALGGRQDISQLESIALPYVLKLVYIAINYVNFILAPLSASSLIISFFGDFGERMQYAVQFSDNCHVFSQLNENSLTLAKGIKKSCTKDTIVFCNTEKADAKLAEKAKKIGGILLYRSCDAIKTDMRHKNYSFYLINDCEDDNIDQSIAVIKKHREITGHHIIVNAFAHNDTNIKVVESLGTDNIEVRFIDEIVLFCNHLIDKHPLYETATEISDGKRLISLTVIGAGRTGTQMIKTAVWAGQLIDFKLKIRVFDNKANDIEKEFFGKCPELNSKEYDIKFIEADVNHSEFAAKIIEHSADTTYAVIAMGDDELNISVADKLQGILRKHNGFQPTPPIFTRVRASVKAKNLSGNKYLANRNIELFGSIDSIYSEKTLLNTELEKLALATHLCYYNVLEKDASDESYCEACKYFITSEYNRRSSMSAALHLKSKELMLGNLKAQKKSDEDIKDLLARNEHDRWIAFMRSAGFCSADAETMRKYAPSSKKDRDDMSKLHVCINSWDKLPELYDGFMALEVKPDCPDFRSSDIKIVTNIQNIKNKAKTL